jgi:pyruvate formate lyase activating enzyme
MGCNFRCPYCHNPELVDETGGLIDGEDVYTFLQSRVGLLDAVTITGGEPTMHEDLPAFIASVKRLGYKVKLDTNGTHPDMLEHLIAKNLIDYVAMDIKAPLTHYAQTVGRPVNTRAIERSIRMLIDGCTAYEFRTTVVKSLLLPDDFDALGEDIHGAKTYYLQKFVPTKTLNPAFLRKTTYRDDELESIRNRMLAHVETCLIRS